MPACCCMTTDCTLVEHQSPEWSLQLTKTKTETKWVVFKCIEDRKHIFRSLNCGWCLGGPLNNTLAKETPKNMNPRSKMVKGQKSTRCFSLSKVQVWPLGLNLERQFCDQFYNVCRYSNKTFHNEAFSPPACVQKTNMVNTGRWKGEQWFDRNREWMLIGILLRCWFLWISHQSLYHSRCQQR